MRQMGGKDSTEDLKEKIDPVDQPFDPDQLEYRPEFRQSMNALRPLPHALDFLLSAISHELWTVSYQLWALRPVPPTSSPEYSILSGRSFNLKRVIRPSALPYTPQIWKKDIADKVELLFSRMI